MAINEAFQVWQFPSKLTFTQVSSPANADIKVKWVTGDHGDGYPFDVSENVKGNVLAMAFIPVLQGEYMPEL